MHVFCLLVFLPEKQNFRIKNPITYVFDEEICNILAVIFYISNLNRIKRQQALSLLNACIRSPLTPLHQPLLHNRVMHVVVQHTGQFHL